MQTLDPISLPLNQSSLIEASAGTGKTHTMVSLYLRLILGVGCQPLSVEQILVVTFTKAATQELQDRIRKQCSAFKTKLKQYHLEQQISQFDSPFELALFDAVRDHLPEAIMRLEIAEENIDLASIFTIHSFCQKMLFQYAFDSGVQFDIDLQPDESELQTRLSQEVWRELFYPMSETEASLVSDILKEPDTALAMVRPYLSGILPPAPTFPDFSETINRYQQFLTEVKIFWLTHHNQLIEPIMRELQRPKNEKKRLDGRAYQIRYLEKWQTTLTEWANQADLSFLDDELSRFGQAFIREKTPKGMENLEFPLFAKIDEYRTAYQADFAYFYDHISAQLFHLFLATLRKKLEAYKAQHKEKGFGDMLSLLYKALYSERGENLASQIRIQFPFAMIDEFQDTDQEQYLIFKRLFLDTPTPQGFIMIGDPKQSIYGFRGADIFTYLAAAKQVKNRFTLDKNWRSLPQLVAQTNRLFDFPKTANQYSPFIYQDIQFINVFSKESDLTLLGDQQSFQCYLQTNESDNGIDLELAAKQCAYLIQQQLKNAENGQAFYQENGNNYPLTTKDIAILVRTSTEARLIKQALAERNLNSVYLSERSSVFASQEAVDLIYILQACLYPHQQRFILTAIGCALWGFTASQIYHLQNNEQAWEAQIERFIHYQKVWQHVGILPMLRQLFDQEGIITRIGEYANAERRLTDIHHLSELLQNETLNQHNESALLHWLEKQVHSPNENQEDQRLRLESEADLIQIITIHSSKGLEYPIVWLPFVAKASSAKIDSVNRPISSIYRNKNEQYCWYYANNGDEEASAFIRQESYAEDLRLLYVAMTRAKLQTNLILPTAFPNKWNAMLYLLSNGNIGLEAKINIELAKTAEYLTAKGIEHQQLLTSVPPEDDWQPALLPLTTNETTKPIKAIQQQYVVTSFTGIQLMHDRNQSYHLHHTNTEMDADEGYDYDSINGNTTQFDELELALLIDKDTNPYSPLQFPHSSFVGNVLHQFLEHCDFSQPIQLNAVETLCQQLSLSEEWYIPTQQWLQQIVTTPFASPEFSLSDINNKQRLNEWQFYLRLSNPDALPQLNTLLRQYSDIAKHQPDLKLEHIQGFIRGFIDCFIRYNEQYYIIDYKSNFLGYLPQDYSIENLQKVIGNHRYDLQYLLYTLAVHRYLTYRLRDNYSYDSDFGGVAYLFLRGMNGDKNSGIYFHKPEKKLIEELDRLFG